VIELLLGLLLQLAFEIVLQIVFEIAATLGWDSLKHSLPREEKTAPWLASVGHFLMGAIAGFVSVLIFDQRLTPRAPVPGLSLILAPVATGAVMRWLGTLWTRTRGEPPTLFTFRGGAIFALGMVLVRLIVFRATR